MERFQLTIAGAALLIGSSVNANLPITNNDGCLEGPMAQFGQYLGSWKITDSQLRADGSGWDPGAGARWDWYCLGDGVAVQDIWLPSGGGTGTNVRTYNTKTERWEILWTFTGMDGYQQLGATHDEQSGQTVIDYLSPKPSPLRRITFFPPNKTGWNWKMEQSTDDGETWREVYRIVATPWADESADP
jgi:hypothetical protein